MRSEALATFYEKMPQMRQEISRAPGYGIIHDNATGKDTYMSAVKFGGGPGVGIADVRAVVVFHDPVTMRQVIDHGWGVSGRAEAAAKVGETGEPGAFVVTLPGMSIYRFTENGAMLGGAIEGTKIWKDAELN